MTVKQLIKKLQSFPQNAVIATTTDNFEQGHSTVEANMVYSFKGEFKEESFRDAFDGGSYTKKVVRHLGDDDKHGLTFIKIG